MDNACKDCTERVVGCHATCERYQKFVAENARKRELIRQDKMKDAIVPHRNNRREHNWKYHS